MLNIDQRKRILNLSFWSICSERLSEKKRSVAAKWASDGTVSGTEHSSSTAEAALARRRRAGPHRGLQLLGQPRLTITSDHIIFSKWIFFENMILNLHVKCFTGFSGKFTICIDTSPWSVFWEWHVLFSSAVVSRDEEETVRFRCQEKEFFDDLIPFHTNLS